MSDMASQLRAMAARLMLPINPMARDREAAALMLKAAEEMERLRNVIFGPLPPTPSAERKEGGK